MTSNMTNQDIKITKMQKDIEYIKENLDDIKNSLQCLENKYAGKWVEKAIVWVVVGVFGSILTYFMKLILK